MASISVCFSPHALARPRVRNPRRGSPKKQNHDPRNPNHSSQLKVRTGAKELSSVGVEATTYTCLPPKEDFSLPSFDPTSFQFSSEVKLSDSGLATEIENETGSLSLSNDEEEEDENDLDDDLGLNYGKFEIFEGNYDSEMEDEDYSDEDEEEVNYGGSVNVYDGEFAGYEDDQAVNVSDNDGVLEGGKVKEKGVPAVMRCFDRAKIFVKAGNGGNGVVAFRREKYVPLGGPSGGDGGRGGNVYIEVDGSMNSLLPFRNSVHFRAGRGSHGLGRMQAGAKGEDVVVKVAPGTVIREAGKDEVLLELLKPGQRALLLPGGRGGRGNASFKSGTNKVPRIAENGEEGPEM